ncbi:MAG TPA: ATP-binding protein [Candidatus Nanoarchaeia archaeon]|nr:ATP-binding protein [Candidatus Nanoarchaeia archaeon]
MSKNHHGTKNSEPTTPFKDIVALDAPTFRNSVRVLTLGGVDFTLWDVTKAALAARLNMGLYGKAGSGKSQLCADIQSLFGNNASYVLGRNDLNIKSLYQQLKFKALTDAMQNGGTVSQKDLTELTADIYRPLLVVEEINRCVEVVQNQFFNIFEGFLELDGTKYPLGSSWIATFRDLGGCELTENLRYSVGVWSANSGGEYTGTVSIDKAMKERSHLILNTNNFLLEPSDIDTVIFGSGGEVRLKDRDDPEDKTSLFVAAYEFLKQQAYSSPNYKEMGLEALLSRYFIRGLDYIPCEAARNSKTIMEEVWPEKAEEDNIGTDDETKLLYRMVAPASARGTLTIISLARALRAYALAKDTKAEPDVVDSVIESFKLVGAYSGMVGNPHRLREDYVGNSYLAALAIGDILRRRLQGKKDLMEAIIYFKKEAKPLNDKILDECQGEYACFR